MSKNSMIKKWDKRENTWIKTITIYGYTLIKKDILKAKITKRDVEKQND